MKLRDVKLETRGVVGHAINGLMVPVKPRFSVCSVSKDEFSFRVFHIICNVCWCMQGILIIKINFTYQA
jgi:hypothetical protein